MIKHLFQSIIHQNLKIKDFNVLIDGKTFFNVQKKKKNKKKTIIEISKNDYYTTGTLLDYEYFFKYYKLIEIYSSK